MCSTKLGPLRNRAAHQVHVPRGGGAHAKKVEENIRSVEEEVQLLQQFDHPNIVRYLVSPPCPGLEGGLAGQHLWVHPP